MPFNGGSNTDAVCKGVKLKYKYNWFWKLNYFKLIKVKLKYNNVTYIGAGSPAGGGAIGGGYLQTMVIISSPSISSPGWKRTTILFEKTLCGS